jgi:hypothetical protein
MTLNEYKKACWKFYGIYIFAFVPLGLVNVELIKYLISASSDYIVAFGQFIRHRFGESAGGAIGGAIGGLMIALASFIWIIPTMKLLKKIIGVKCPSCGTLLVDKHYYEYAINNFRCLNCKTLIITQPPNQSYTGK